MIILQTAKTLVADVEADTAITITVFGLDDDGAGGRVYSTLYQGQPVTTETTLFTVPAGHTYFVKTIIIANPTATARWVKLWSGGNANSNVVLPQTNIGIGEHGTYSNGWRFYDVNGGIKGASSGTAAHSSLTGLTDGDDHTQYQKESEKAAASGYASLGADSLVPQDQLGTGAQDGTKFLRDDGTWQVAGGGAADVQVFTADGTWTKPAGKTVTEVFIIGAGGGGGSGGRGFSKSGGGGAGGAAYQKAKFRISNLGATEAVTVGAGGSGAASLTADGDGTAGGNGEPSTFGSWLTANGGAAGSGGGDSFGDAGPGGINSVTSNQYADDIFNGGSGGAGDDTSPGVAGGAITWTTMHAATPIFGGTGGGGGGGDGATAGGAGGARLDLAGGTAGAINGGATGAGNSSTNDFLPGTGGGGSGGSSSAGTNSAAGGIGGRGAGGGGGGASETGNSGAGGLGGDGCVIVISY